MIDPDCHFGDHLWKGTGACVRCHIQLRCGCGQFVREDGLEEHIKTCPLVFAIQEEERRSIESTFG